MKRLLVFISLAILFSCDSEEMEDDPRTAFFTLTYENIAGNCNSTTLKFEFLVTRVEDGLQQSHTVDSGQVLTGSLIGFDDGNTLNVKVFAASSPDPLHEANIPFIYNNYSDEQLRSDNNKLEIKYCHQEDIGNITWVFSI